MKYFVKEIKLKKSMSPLHMIHLLTFYVKEHEAKKRKKKEKSLT